MYVNGKRNEGGMVERQYGRAVYESIVYRRRDPALLEMMEGNVFKMRVFPIFGRREKRIGQRFVERKYKRVSQRFNRHNQKAEGDQYRDQRSADDCKGGGSVDSERDAACGK